MTKPSDHHGAPFSRVEDDQLLRGHGRFVDDEHLAGAAHGWFVRSPHAHAKIRSINHPRRAAEGVIAVLTAADLKAAGVGNVSAEFPDGRARRRQDRDPERRRSPMTG